MRAITLFKCVATATICIALQYPLMAQTSGIIASVRSLDQGAVQQYIRSGGDLEERDGLDNTALLWAVALRSRPLVRALLAGHANVNATNSDGRNPLHVAAKQGQADIAEELLKAGADPWAEDNEGQTPVVIAEAVLSKDTVALLKQEMEAHPREGSLFASVVAGKSGEWSQWRGPNSNGATTDGPTLATAWPSGGPKRLWEVNGLPQGGSGSPAVADGKVFIYIHDAHVTGIPSFERPYPPRDIIYCFDLKSGNSLWRRELPGEETWHEGSATPCVVGGKVYIMTARTAYCLTASSGEVVWKYRPRVQARDGAIKADAQEISSSFVVYGGVAAVCMGPMCGLNATTGSVLWRSPEAGGYAGAMTSGALWLNSGAVYLVYGGFYGLFCVDMHSGQQLWKIVGNTRGGDFASSPAIERNYLAMCQNGELRAYKLSRSGAQQLWGVRNLDPYASPVISKGLVYMVDKKSVTCYNVRNGAVVWRTDIERSEFASPVFADDKLFVLYDRNMSIAMFGGSQWGGRMLASHRFRPTNVPTFWASPTISDGKLVLRRPHGLICFDVSARGIN